MENITRPQENKILSITETVREDMLAVKVGSGTLRVLATPVLAAIFEKAAVQLAASFLQPGWTTVGTEILIQHQAPTPLGVSITATAILTKREGRTFYFNLSAQDEQGLVASGKHIRVAVAAERFQQKAETRK